MLLVDCSYMDLCSTREIKLLSFLSGKMRVMRSRPETRLPDDGRGERGAEHGDC